MSLTFSSIDLESNTIDADTYYDFLRQSIITQPEFLYASSNFIEKDQQLKFSKRQTDNVFTNKSFVEKFLNSVKSKMYSNRK